VLEQMRDDEVKHAQIAVAIGARQLPAVVKSAMATAAALMVSTTYYL
jgi:ubiquinone biosynthesis monooxygenase Coq7